VEGEIDMGISMSVLMIMDRQIRKFRKHPRRAAILSNKLIAHGGDTECCHLHSSWTRIHDLLSHGRREGEMPFWALRRGEVVFNPRGFDPTWAIYSPSAKRLAEEMRRMDERYIGDISRPWGERYVAMIKEAQQAGATAYMHTDPNKSWRRSLSEVMSYTFKLRDFSAEAARTQQGLMFCRFED